jgi:hypothetical protein
MKFDNMPVKEHFLGLESEDERLESMASDSDYRGYFTRKQLDLIEQAFEATEPSIHYPPGISELASKFAWGKEDKERLIAIMKNIIDNGGDVQAETVLRGVT